MLTIGPWKTKNGGQLNALHALSCALGYNIRWLMRALQGKARKALLCLLRMAAAGGQQGLWMLQNRMSQLLAVLGGGSVSSSLAWPVPRSLASAR
jgi:hypothetical protein